MPLVILLDGLGVTAGTLLGWLFRRRIPESLYESENLALAAVSAAIGIQLVRQAVHMPVAVLALLLGGALGHYAGIDEGLSALSGRLSGPRMKKGAEGKEDSAGTESEVLLVAFVLYCISTTGLIGALTLGFSGDGTVLVTKSVMDFTASVFFAKKSGPGLALISLPLLLVLTVTYLMSGKVMPLVTPALLGDFSACGGMIQLLNALRITKLKDPPVADYLVSLILVFFISAAWTAFS